MKYSLLFSILSLIAWKYDYMTWAGISGLIGGFLYLLAFRKQLQLILIAAIGAGVISIMLFPPEMSPDVLIYIGISWAVSITVLFILLIVISFFIKSKEKFFK